LNIAWNWVFVAETIVLWYIVHMKIIPNIIPMARMKLALNALAPYKRQMEEARKIGDNEAEREAILKCAKTWSTNVLKMFEADVEVLGRENIPEKGPVVFVGNHQGYGDILLCLYAFDRFQVGFLAKSTLEKVPWYGKWIKDIRSIYIERDDSRASLKAINEGIELLEQGFSLVVFPEGTRSKGPDIQEFRRGPLRLATKPGIPIIPFSIQGSYRFFEEKDHVQKGVTMKMMIHPMVETKGLTKAEIRALDDQIEATVRSGMEILK
jgi:1-acyl-sn-glycerol-3-phosphate acyltransferase